MHPNRSMPEQHVIPVLAYPDVAAAIQELSAAFGFTERWRVSGHRAQLDVGGGAAIALTHAEPPAFPHADHVMLRVADVDTHCQRARAAGLRVVSAPADQPYGERQYTAQDSTGRRWVFTQSTADLPPEAWGAASGPALR